MLKVSIAVVASLVVSPILSFAQGTGQVVTVAKEAPAIIKSGINTLKGPGAATKTGPVEFNTAGARVSEVEAGNVKKQYKTSETGALVRGSQYTTSQTGAVPTVQVSSGTTAPKFSAGSSTAERSNKLVRPSLVKTVTAEAPVATKEAAVTAAPEFTGQTVTVGEVAIMMENPTEASKQAVTRIASANKIVYETTGETLVGPETCAVTKYSEPGLINIAEESVAGQTSVRRYDRGDCAKWKLARSYLNTTQSVLKFDIKSAKMIMNTRHVQCKTPSSFNPADFVTDEGTMKPAPANCSI